MAELDRFEARFAAAYRRYLDEVPTEVDAAAVARTAALQPRVRRLALPWALRPVPALAWLLLLAALLAALAGTVLVAARLLESAPRVPPLGAALVPTGIEVLTPETGGYALVVADGKGILWAREPGGRLVRFDPASGSAQAWTIRDDAGFGVTTTSGADILPAREGGVWLVGQRTLRLFDGEVFRQVIDAPTDIGIAVEAPDGSLWATTGPWPTASDGALLHWDGSSWSSIDLGGASGDGTVGAIAVDAAGRPWIGWVRDVEPPTPRGSPVYAGSVWRYDGSSWTTFDATDAAALGGGVFAIAQLPDGDVWVASAAGLARFDGSSWTDAEGPSSTWGASVAAGPEGAIWIATGDSADGAVRVARVDGQSLVSYGPSDGLPGPNESGYAVAWALPTNDGVFVGTGAGIYRLADGHWERAWPRDASPGMDPVKVVAVSHEELWAIEREGGLWHFQADAWTRESIDTDHPEGEVRALTIGPDGTLWAAGTDGIAYRHDGRWTIVDAAEASAITVGRDGTVWVGGGSGEECRVWSLMFDGTAWAGRAVAGCPPGSFGRSTLAIDPSDTLWAGTAPGCAWGMSGCTQGGLARLDGQSWEAIRGLGGSELTTVTILGTSPTGEMWVVDDPTESGDPAQQKDPIRAARFDGTDWTVVALPEGFMSDIAVAPDGSLWAWTWWVPASAGGGDRGPARYDGTAWTFPYDGAGLPWMKVAAVAPDGTVFGEYASSIFRFPDLTARP